MAKLDVILSVLELILLLANAPSKIPIIDIIIVAVVKSKTVFAVSYTHLTLPTILLV